MNQTTNTPTTTLEDIQNFLEGFREIRKKHKTFLTEDEFMSGFLRFRDEYLEVKTKSDRRQLSEAPQYNIFNILGVTRSEVRTHSTFLCDLLSPRSSHGQGLLFLKYFLEHCASRFPDEFPKLPDFYDPKKWQVFSEYNIGTGRMDILIHNPQEGFICVIENKVDAYEGFDQLARYGKWIKDREKKYPNSALCFLTIRGTISITAGGINYFRLSYHQDVAEWLEDTIPHIQAPGVKAIVHQYQAIAINL
jgi:hypothetical protein